MADRGSVDHKGNQASYFTLLCQPYNTVDTWNQLYSLIQFSESNSYSIFPTSNPRTIRNRAIRLVRDLELYISKFAKVSIF